jgi:hypothetical protein
MPNIKLVSLFSLLICSTAMVALVTNARIESVQVVTSKKNALENSFKRALAKELMTKIGIDRKYNLYFMVMPICHYQLEPSQNNDRELLRLLKK